MAHYEDITTKVPTILWVDLRLKRFRSNLYMYICERYPTYHIDNTAILSHAMQQVSPNLLFFDYDYPDEVGLKALQQTKLSYASLPILMLTEYHSEALAIWAFRTKVWDYHIKPVKPEDVADQIKEIFKLLETSGLRDTRTIPNIMHSIPVDVRYSRVNNSELQLLPALAYIEAHYHEKITLEEMSDHCKMGPFQFSRAFKQVKGITFREFLLRYRIDKSLMLMKAPSANITEIAFSVGFNDLSHFATMFRRYTGLSPSRYRKENSYL